MKLTTRVFLAATGVGMIGVLGVPLTFYPHAWARYIGWDPPERPLDEYFSRSLGATCCGATFGRRAPKSLLFALAGIGAGAAVVHALGRGRYPAKEALEAPLLAAWSAVAAGVWVSELI
jgi:hypothetical protein